MTINLQTDQGTALDEVAASFDKPIAQEQVHQEVISDWIKQLVLDKASS